MNWSAAPAMASNCCMSVSCRWPIGPIRSSLLLGKDLLCEPNSILLLVPLRFLRNVAGVLCLVVLRRLRFVKGLETSTLS